MAYFRELLQNTPEEIILPKELKLAVGDSSEWVPELRKRLTQLQYYTHDYPDKDDSTQYIYGGILSDQLAVFQRAFGLEADSVVGEQTIKKLNITFAEKIKTIKINMERWRWLPRNFMADTY
ncbi:MAG: peptidoglycan-binding protein [Chitinophagales bacterium]|nr:peptidoglycan-binding protein [Chitinophagales bacterium]